VRLCAAVQGRALIRAQERRGARPPRPRAELSPRVFIQVQTDRQELSPQRVRRTTQRKKGELRCVANPLYPAPADSSSCQVGGCLLRRAYPEKFSNKTNPDHRHDGPCRDSYRCGKLQALRRKAAWAGSRGRAPRSGPVQIRCRRHINPTGVTPCREPRSRTR
jgi:hypothetical protein